MRRTQNKIFVFHYWSRCCRRRRSYIETEWNRIDAKHHFHLFYSIGCHLGIRYTYLPCACRACACAEEITRVGVGERWCVFCVVIVDMAETAHVYLSSNQHLAPSFENSIQFEWHRIALLTNISVDMFL